jgi:hypothetical protein
VAVACDSLRCWCLSLKFSPRIAIGKEISHNRPMVEGFEGYLASWLGDAKSVGADSWLHWLSWVAALLLAMFAWISLRRQSLQSRATLLLSLYTQWESLSTHRKAFSRFQQAIRHDILHKNATRNSEQQIIALRQRYKEEMLKMRLDQSPEFYGFISYISFFELIGTYVRQGYIPMRDVRLLYKGPVLDLEMASIEFIATWQNEAHTPPGLLENAIYLMKEMRVREDRPIYYRMGFQWKKIFG